MRETKKLSSAGSGLLSMGVPWQADKIVIVNPTIMTLAVRTGGQSPPNSTVDADWLCPPITMMCLPTFGNECGFRFTTPTLLSAPDNMPTVATLTMLSAEEQAPSFGSVALAGTIPNAEKVLTTFLITAPGSGSGSFTAPDGIRSLSFVASNPDKLTAFEVTDNSGGVVYYSGNPSVEIDSAGRFNIPYFDMDTALGATFRYSWTRSAVVGSSPLVSIIGYYDRRPIGLFDHNGRQFVSPWPDVPSPTLNGIGGSVTPAGASIVVAQSTFLVPGDYRIECEMSCSDLPAVGRYLNLLIQNAAAAIKQWVACPSGAATSTILSRIPILAGDTIQIQYSAVASGAGSVYIGSYRAYKLT